MSYDINTVLSDSNHSKVLTLSASANAIPGFDLVELSWRYTKADAAKGLSKDAKAPKMVYLPVLQDQIAEILEWESVQLTDPLQDWQQVLLNAIGAQRETICKALVESNSNVIPHDSVSVAVCIATMLAERESERLNGDKIEAWFKADASMSASLTSMAEARSKADNKPLDVWKATLHNAWLKACKSLAAPNPAMTENDRNKLVSVLQSCEQTQMRDALIAKANKLEYQSAL